MEIHFIKARRVFMHILVVEDEKTLCETIARSMKRLAYSVDCCYDGLTAMQMLAVNPS